MDMRIRYDQRDGDLRRPYCTVLLLLFLAAVAGCFIVLASPAAAAEAGGTPSGAAPSAAAKAGKDIGKQAPAAGQGTSKDHSSKEQKSQKAHKPSRKAKKSQDKAGADKAAQQRAVHGNGFGFETQRSRDFWSSNGIGGSQLMQHAVKGKKAKQGQSPDASQPSGQQENKKKDFLNFSVDREKSDWRAKPGKSPGEDVSIESQHRVRAFATTEDDDVSLGLGPEVVVRDQQKSGAARNSSQPDVDAGVGMRLKLAW